MPVSPDVMDGVPEEPGYYWVNHINFDEWKLYKIDFSEYADGKRLKAVRVDNWNYYFDEDQFCLCNWSEKIEPPEVE